jgi:hypothetical protein
MNILSQILWFVGLLGWGYGMYSHQPRFEVSGWALCVIGWLISVGLLVASRVQRTDK